MLETESGDQSMADIDAAEQNQSLYLPDQSFRLRYRSSPVAAGESVGASSLPMKQLFAAVAAASAAVGPVGPSSSFGNGVSFGPKTERIAPMDSHQRDTGHHARHLGSYAAMPRFGKHVLAPSNTAIQNANPFRSNGEAGGNFGKTEQRDRATQDGTPAECSGYEMHKGSDVGQPDELQLDASKVNDKQDQDVSVIASSLSHLIFMQQNGVNKGSSEVSSGLKSTADDMTPCRQMAKQLLGEVHMRSDVPQSSALHPPWDGASHKQLNQQQQLINQLLLSRASHLLPSLNSDLATDVAKIQHSAQRPLQQVPPTSKLTQDWWLSEELVNGGNMLSLHQNQQNTQFDATKFSVINQDFLDILQTSEHLKMDSTGSLLSGLSPDQIVPNLMSPVQSSGIHLGLQVDHFSRKVFIGGLPPDIAEEEITRSFRQFGPLVVDWPHKAEMKSYFPPKGYCFLLFQDEMSVQALINSCVKDDGKLYWSVSSPTIKDKPVQIRPWNLADSDFVMNGSQPLDPRRTIFVGGVPRPLRAVELAVVMNRLYGGVCYAGIDTDPELKYPKGAGRVAFSSQQSYIAAISARFVQLQHADIDKRVEVKPYVLDDQLCDECQGVRSGGQFAPYFCANVACLQYYCEHCWSQIHARPGREFHKPLVKEGADRSRSSTFRWC